MALSFSAGAEGRAADLSSARPTLARIVDAVIDDAPDAVHARALLQAIDWSGVAPARVAGMLASLNAQGIAPPRALATALLAAGHAMPPDAALSPELRALSELNRGTAPTVAATDHLCRLFESGSVTPEVAGAIVRRLVTLGADAAACDVALAAGRLAPDALGPVRTRLDAHLAVLPDVRIRLAGFSTTEPLAADLVLAFASPGGGTGAGLRRHARITPSCFGAAITALLEPDANADLHIVLLDLDGLAPPDWRQPAATVHARLTERADSLAAALSAYAACSPSPLLINTIPMPSAPTAGLLDGRHIAGSRRAAQLVNERLLAAAGRHGNVIVIDTDQALADLPASRHCDARLWFYGRIAYSAEATRALADAFARTWALMTRGPAKVLALDLDNTLWGGTYGEDGIGRLACGLDFPGSAFRAFQQECLRLKQQGLLLLALSKNDPEAMSVFARHPGMALRADDFAATAVSWSPKPEGLRRIAAELNLGLDSFVLLDDSPHEREAMRRLAPEVIVPELPADPAQRPAWLRRLACTWPVRLTEEDARRSELYAAERNARALQASAATVEDYLRGLDQRLTVSLAGPDAVARVAQMHQRTNQFNLTTRRLTEAQVAAMVASPGRALVLMGRVADKLGDHGIVIAATVAIDGADAEIQTFLMSCRVIGREIEGAFLSALLALLSRRGVGRVIGRFAATARNGMVRNFYAANGFTFLEGDDGASAWGIDLAGERPQCPYVTLITEA